MRFVVDMNLSPEWCDVLIASGWEAVHWSSIGAATAFDDEILGWALANETIVLTQDLDFGAILAATNANSPSVVLLRCQDSLPVLASSQLIPLLQQNEPALQSGALLVVDTGRSRIRMLPLRTRPDHLP